jgi:hypothetical protein
LVYFVGDVISRKFLDACKTGKYYWIHLGLKIFHSSFLTEKPVRLDKSEVFYKDPLNICAYYSAEGGNIHIFREFFQYPQVDWLGCCKIAIIHERDEIIKEIMEDDRFSPCVEDNIFLKLSLFRNEKCSKEILKLLLHHPQMHLPSKEHLPIPEDYVHMDVINSYYDGGQESKNKKLKK